MQLIIEQSDLGVGPAQVNPGKNCITHHCQPPHLNLFIDAQLSHS
jgi:hypothetical protein